MAHHLAVFADDEDLGNAVNLVALGHLSLVVHQRGEGIALLLEKLASDLRLLVIDPQDHQVSILELAVQLLNVRQLHPARSTPTGPEIEQHDLASQAAQIELFSLQVNERKVGGCGPGELDPRPGLGDAGDAQFRHLPRAFRGSEGKQSLRDRLIHFRGGERDRLFSVERDPGWRPGLRSRDLSQDDVPGLVDPERFAR